MVLSPVERDELVTRVERRLGQARVPRAAIADAVDRVARALQRQTAESIPETVMAVSAISTPDLASRLRRALERDGVMVGELASATEGRHTVVTLQVPPSGHSALERAAAAAGARIAQTGQRL
jgi:hypothetical protein